MIPHQHAFKTLRVEQNFDGAKIFAIDLKLKKRDFYQHMCYKSLEGGEIVGVNKLLNLVLYSSRSENWDFLWLYFLTFSVKGFTER